MPAEAYDVAVVGAGGAGAAAALSASRLGARTLLVEREELLGGNAANAQVHTICGLYVGDGAGRPEPVHPGFPSRFVAGLAAAGAAASEPEWNGRVAVLPTSPSGLAAHLAERCARAERLEVRTRCRLVEASLSAGPAHPSELTVCDGEVRSPVRAAVIIDASGDGTAAALGGADFEQCRPEVLQSPSFIAAFSGVDSESLAGTGRLRVSHAVARASRSGALPEEAGSATVRRGAAGEVYLTLNVPKLADRPYAPLDEAYRLALEDRARDLVGAIATFLSETRPEFQDSRVAAWPRRLGVRETRRVSGVVRLEAEDVLAGRRRDDEVALSAWPIELWRDHRRARFQYPEAPCSVPLGALVSRSHPRLGTAGRCLSASHEALGALRVIGTALATGEAVGIAAALAADAGGALADVDPAAVRARIRDDVDPEGPA